MPLDIISKDNLFDLEGKLRVLESEPEGAEATIRLARQTSGDFFCESRIATIIATCARRFALITRDWHNLWEPHLLQEHFGASLAGLTAALYSRQLTNIVHVQFPQSSTELLERITTAGGILEPKESRGSSITFCAFDPDWTEPAALSGTVTNRPLFKRTFAAYRTKYLEIGTGLQHTAETREADNDLADFVFELYQNTFEHGRLDAHDRPIPGMRYVRLRKHIGVNKASLVSRAGEWPELKAYLEWVIPNGKEFKLYEITVSDQGLGMIGRLTAKRPDLVRPLASVEERTALLNEMLLHPVTSKRDFPGTGYGLSRTLRAISRLQGFVSLRTDRSWLYGSSAIDEELEKTGLKPVPGATDLPKVTGTLFNILLPMRMN